MSRECPGCGATTTHDARFCRRCGAPLKSAVGHDTDPPVSPVAQTVPLTDEGRATHGLDVEESQPLGEGTSRLRRTEMEELLRRVAREHGGDGRAAAAPPVSQSGGSSALPDTTAPAAPVTSALKMPGDGTSDSNSSAPLAQGQTTTRPVHRRWRLLAFSLLCLALFGGVLVFIALRRSKASDARAPAAPPASEQTQPVTAAQEDAPQNEPLTVESPPPTDIPRPSPAQRPRGTEAASQPHAPVEAPALPGASPAPTAPAPGSTQATTTPPALSATDHYQRGVQLWATDRRAALEEFRAAVPAVPDAYYYLGSEYYSEARDVKSLSDGELRAALNYFTRATSGPHSAQASRHVQALGKEYDRRKRKQSRP